MSNHDQSSAAAQGGSEVISLQTVVDAHLQRLVACQSAVLSCHAGLLGLDEAQMEHYCSLTPPWPSFGESTTFLQTSLRARQWLAASALRDLVMLHSIYFEQMRQFLGLARILEGAGSEEEKRQQARAMVADKPVDSASMLARLDDLIHGCWPCKTEYQSLETLYAAFSAVAAGQRQGLAAEPLHVQLCLPQIEGQPIGPNIHYSLRRITRTFAEANEMEPDRALFYEIFFTAFTICKESSQAVATGFASQTTASEGHGFTPP